MQRREFFSRRSRISATMEKRQRTDDGAEPRCRYLRVHNLPGAAGGAPELRALLEPHGKVEDALRNGGCAHEFDWNLKVVSKSCSFKGTAWSRLFADAIEVLFKAAIG